MAPLSVLIVGCGVAGPTLATFLLRSPLPAAQLPHITIVERSSSPRPHGQNVDIRGAGIKIIRKLGLEAKIRAATTGEEGVYFVDENNAIWAEGPADKTGKVQTGTSDCEILRGRLAKILFERSREVSGEVEKEGGRGVEYLFGELVEEIEQHGEKVEVRFKKSGESRQFDLVIGADGLQSSTRKMVWGEAGEEERVKRLGMYGGFFSMPKSETDSLWRRWYHAPGRRGVMVRPSDPETRDRTTVFMAVVNDEDLRLREAATSGHKGAKTQKKLMREYFEHAGWECPRICDEMDAADDFYYDMIGQVKMDKWNKGRVVLLADAGYCASPISGMGTTLALSGAYNLAGALSSNPDDLEKAFAEYEEHMRPTVIRAQKLAPGMPRLFHPETAWGVWTMHVLAWAIWRSGIIDLLARWKGPPANEVPVEEYGFRQLPEMEA